MMAARIKRHICTHQITHPGGNIRSNYILDEPQFQDQTDFKKTEIDVDKLFLYSKETR